MVRRMTTLDTILALLNNGLYDVNEEAVKPDSYLMDGSNIAGGAAPDAEFIGLDSLDQIHLIMEIEDIFKVDIDVNSPLADRVTTPRNAALVVDEILAEYNRL